MPSLLCLSLLLVVDAPAAEPSATSSVASADVAIRLLVAGIDPSATDRWTAQARDRIAEQVATQPAVDRFTGSLRMQPSEEQVESAYAAMATELTRRSADATIAQTLKAAGTTPEALRRYLMSEMAFSRFLRETLTADQIAAEFQTHRSWYDGTEVDIEQTVAAADGTTSQSAFTIRGLRSAPRPIVEAALAGEVGATLDPISVNTTTRTIRIVDRRDGEGSLEDARPMVLAEIARRLREDIVSGRMK